MASPGITSCNDLVCSVLFCVFSIIFESYIWHSQGVICPQCWTTIPASLKIKLKTVSSLQLLLNLQSVIIDIQTPGISISMV